MFEHIPQQILIRALREYCDLHDTDTDASLYIESYFDSDSSTSKSSIIRSLLSQEKQKKNHIDGEKSSKLVTRLSTQKKNDTTYTSNKNTCRSENNPTTNHYIGF